ncbi:MAG: FtsX-like permease family protein [Devosia nanyangense]|uniref:FtsX-like permease family protein n=1 Tax=Devosia nanyangense TaxID=1228055 RepID=A0A933L077_9HYPH|nr:FtsX-like permease family protein [Devosia nanyangense]
MTRLGNWMRVAMVDLRGDLRRFGILLACLALGTGTIAGVSSVGAALQGAILRDANTLLGGDIEASRPDRRATAEEMAYFQTLGRVAETEDSNSRADAVDDSGNTAFLDILAVDDNYPLLGKVVSPQLSDGHKPSELLALRDGVYGAIVDPVLLDRLGVDMGGHFKVNGTEFEIRGLLTSVPDGAVRGFHLGLTAVMSIAAAEANPNTRPPLPGLLTQHRYKIALSEGDYTTAMPAVAAHFADDPSWKVRSPREAAGQLARFYDLFVRFLLIVGLSSLLVGGVGISNAVSADISERQRSIATLRSLGATGPRILVHFFTQIGVLSLIGIAIGLAIGATLTAAALPILGQILKVDLPPSVDFPSLGTALAFGVLAAFAFSYLPLVRAEKLKPAMLFRTVGTSVQNLKTREYLEFGVVLPIIVSGLGIFGLAVWATHDSQLVLWYAVGVIGAFLLLRAAGLLLQMGLRALPPLPNVTWRNAFRGIYRPGSPAPVVVMSLGRGLAMLLVIVILSANLRNQLLGEVQKDAPTFVTTDLFDDEVADLQAFLDSTGEVTDFRHSAMIRAAITKVNGVPSKEIKNISEESTYMLTGEILMTWRPDLPADSRITDGAWWPADYDGPPLVSLRDKAKADLHLNVGDTIELTLFGESITVTIANFRDFQFQNGLNFFVTASPHTFDAFPGSNLATIKAKQGDEKDLERKLARQYPDITFIPVGDALNQAAGILGQLSTAVNIVGALAVINGLLVLAGTMAAGRKQRESDAVVNKVLGSTRGDVVRVFALEYALLGGFSALLATAVGIAGAYAIVKMAKMDIGFGVDPVLVLQVLIGSVALTIFTGALTTWSALSTKPAQYLRALG